MGPWTAGKGRVGARQLSRLTSTEIVLGLKVFPGLFPSALYSVNLALMSRSCGGVGVQ